MFRSTRMSAWIALPIVALTLLASSVFVSTAQAAPGNGEGRGQAQAQARHAAAQQKARQNQESREQRRSTSSQGRSAVAHEKPNDYQAQSDPDGMENGGVDQPGGTGGTIGAQDGDNGSGDDVDCEDDNRGVGVPGHCDDDAVESEPTPAEVVVVAETVVEETPIVLGVSAERPAGTELFDEVAGVSAERDGVLGRAVPTILPDTGLAANLALLAALGVALTVVGGVGLRRRGSRA